MSMLSAQCDELRERAKTLRQGRWSDGADDARLMEDAAETILSLRDRAQALQAENAKLRELVRDMFRDFANADYELKRNHGRTFMAVTRYEPRMRELGVDE